MKFIHCSDISKCIRYVLSTIDDESSIGSNIVYINSFMPHQLNQVIEESNFGFKNDDEFMKRFQYYKINSLADLHSLLKSFDESTIVIIESLNQVTSISKGDYNEANSLLVRIFMTAKVFEKCYLLSRIGDRYLEYFCDDIIGL